MYCEFKDCSQEGELICDDGTNSKIFCSLHKDTIEYKTFSPYDKKNKELHSLAELKTKSKQEFSKDEINNQSSEITRNHYLLKESKKGYGDIINRSPEFCNNSEAQEEKKIPITIEEKKVFLVNNLKIPMKYVEAQFQELIFSRDEKYVFYCKIYLGTIKKDCKLNLDSKLHRRL